ncbi:MULTISPECIES: MalM family protein [unclassified Agarivorans]|uniref:MalM family protein n=1 Tax=unclassified Agarivorans TaxID=2636026 RepID=UPI0026E14462|nr:MULTISPECIES: MalM family protein [unclassified Agarivorans]MDO6684640.1 MalM family protein [Agarivorans sp. 3_MG-2023]MDO6714805.1 MalM family protein [Agarivorans sp. 2_MG-2023]
MKTILAASMMLALAACSNQNMVVDYGTDDTKEIQKVSPEEGYAALARAPICCDSLTQFDYQLVTAPGKLDFTITASDPVFSFSSGRSFVKAFELPNAVGAINIDVSAPIVNSVFVPSILVLDEEHQPLQLFDSNTIKYDSSSIVTVDRYYGNILLPSHYGNQQKAKYLLVFTTTEAMQQQTKLTPPDSKAAETGRVDVNMKIHMNKPIPHTAIGAARLAFDYIPAGQQSAEAVAAAAVVATSTRAVTIEPSQSSVDSISANSATINTQISTIEPEVAAIFEQLIQQAVADGNYDKALKIVKDAEQAGLINANEVFVKAVKAQ